MIQCPVCKSMCFDDMEICYGCMHRFDDPLVSSDGYTPSGLPEFEVEEPASDLIDMFSMNQVAIDPVSFVIPASGQVYNLTISIQPIQERPEAKTASGLDEVVRDDSSMLVANLESPDTSLCSVPA